MSDSFRERHPFLWGMMQVFGIFQPRRYIPTAEESMRQAADKLDAAMAKARLLELLDLHRPGWLNCINACCSGEQCKHRTRYCVGCEANWPCETVLIIGKHVAEAHLT